MATTPDPQPIPAKPASRWVALRLFLWLFHPRRLRIYLFTGLCLITLAALFTLIENWRGYRAWERVRRGYEAAGEPLSLQDVVPPTVPDDENFAMTPFLAPLYDFEPGTQHWRDTNGFNRAFEPVRFRRLRGLSKDRSNRWMQGQLTDLTTWAVSFDPSAPTDTVADSARTVIDGLREFEAVIEELHQASQRPYARFNVAYEAEDPAGILLPHLSVLRALIEIIALRASAQLALHKPDAALRDLQLGLYLIDAIRKEPWLISYISRCGALQRLMQPIWEGCARKQWSEHDLATLQTALDQNKFWPDWIHALRKERAICNDRIDRIRRNPTLLPHALFPLESGPENPWVANLLLRCIPRGWFYQEQVQYNRLFDRTLLGPLDQADGYAAPDAIRAASAELNRALTHDRALQAVTRHRVMVGAFIKGPWDLPSIHDTAARAHVSTDLAKTACALERHRLAHGDFPASLDDLAPAFLGEVPRDLIRGQPLVYRRLDDLSFLLYSIGWNGVDNGGLPPPDRDASPDSISGDWVWPSSASEP
jgi:hypothetical protein